MHHIWHYTEYKEFPTSECDCLCRLNKQHDYKYITIHYFENGDCCSIETGDLIDVSIIEAWTNLDDI